MSFLSTNSSEFLSARITKKGRKSIAEGNFVISYFQIGDSEFDYTKPFDLLDGIGGKSSQRVFAPTDREPGVKYPYKLDTGVNSTTYGVPIPNSQTETIRNVMGPAGFVTEYNEFDGDNGTVVACPSQTVDLSFINGTNNLVVPTGSTFFDCGYITLVLNGSLPDLIGDDPTIVLETNSQIYKIVSITGNTLVLDRNMPNLQSFSGTTEVICNDCSIEYPVDVECGDSCFPLPIDSTTQHDPWTLEVVWGEYPIGYTGITNNDLSGFTGSQFISTKEYLGYTTSSGQSINTGTTYTNSFGETIYVTPEEQRVIAVVHYSELGDIKNDPERFFKYDDYISTNNVDSIVDDVDGNPLTDCEYFEVYIPFIKYHRNTSNTVGAIFHMDTVDHFVTTPTTILQGRSSLPFRYLLDENNNRVGRILYTYKTIVFDDQELVAILDYRSNRKYTLPAPKSLAVASDLPYNQSLFSGGTNQSYWLTYTFVNSSDPNMNALPCNYYVNVIGSAQGDACQVTTASNILFKFNTDSFKFMKTTLAGGVNGYSATDFKLLLQETNSNEYPSPDLWREIDYTSLMKPFGGTYLDPANIENISFVVNKTMYDTAPFFNLEDYMGNGYFVHEPSTDPNFGDEQPFPGSIRLVRATDIEVLNFLINLPSTQFTATQNPTYVTGETKRITEVALLNNNKEPLVVGKTAKPLTRSGTQVFSIKLDF